MNDHAPHILVVDDDDRLRDLLKQYLSGNGYRVTAAGDAADARARLRSMAFDLIVLDVMMPGEDGLALTASLKQVSETPILLLTARNEPEDRIDGLERGADDYLAKPFEPRELVLRISNLLRRAPRAAPAPVLRLGEHSFDVERTELTRNDLAVHLTPAERRLLRAFALRPGVTLSRDALAADSRIAGSARTVDVQVTRLRRKIEPDPRFPRYLQTVRGEGYVLQPD
ncbi:MAG: response regulator transcription factor [Defluviicoccus sp.]|nr:response regulator transcription factor [Defluviicoccus sp.]MDE0276579.1 response regulator transcription factor [Defluviicoccus sp.]